MKSTFAAAVILSMLAGGAFCEEVTPLKGPFPAPEDFAVAKTYTGSTRLPDFKRRDKAFRLFRTRIRDGLKEGPNFAGEYSVIQYGCGTGCSNVVIASNRTGQAFSFPLGGEYHAFIQLRYSLESRLMLAQWYDYDKDNCIIDFYDWQSGQATLIKRGRVGNIDICYKLIGENLNEPTLNQPPLPQ